MSNTITINGKGYKAKFCNVGIAKRVYAIEMKMQELDKQLVANPDMVDYDAKYDALWQKRVGFVLEGDVSELSIGKISVMEARELDGFFLKQFSMTRSVENSEKDLQDSNPSN